MLYSRDGLDIITKGAQYSQKYLVGVFLFIFGKLLSLILNTTTMFMDYDDIQWYAQEFGIKVLRGGDVMNKNVLFLILYYYIKKKCNQGGNSSF
jgi:hypothetical protein